MVSLRLSRYSPPQAPSISISGKVEATGAAPTTTLDTATGGGGGGGANLFFVLRIVINVLLGLFQKSSRFETNISGGGGGGGRIALYGITPGTEAALLMVLRADAGGGGETVGTDGTIFMTDVGYYYRFYGFIQPVLIFGSLYSPHTNLFSL